MKHFAFLIVALLTALTPINSAAAQGIDSKGKEFILSFLPNFTSVNISVELHLTADAPTNVTVEYPVNAPTFSTSVPVTPGAITTVSLPISAASAFVQNTIQNNAVRLTAVEEFSAYMINRIPATSDAAVALPIDVMNTEYIVMTYDESFAAAQFAVVAAFDNTMVTITPSRELEGGQSTGVPFNVILNRGETFFVEQASIGANGGLAGTLVSATKPVGMTNGNKCTQVPFGTPYCDTLFEVAAPVQTWGKNLSLVNVAGRPGGSYYRVLASVDNTEIFLDSVSQGTINRGQFLEIGPLPGNHLLTSANPIFAALFIAGSEAPGAVSGDPSMSNIIPNEQFLSGYTFSTVGAGQFTQHFLTLVVHNLDVGTMSLDGSPVPSGQFSPIAGSDFSAAVVSVSEGTHQTTSARPHGLSVLGYTGSDSYMYPAGAGFNFINPVGDENAPICSLSGLNGTASDNRPSEDINSNNILDPGEDLNSNGKIDTDTGIYFVQLIAGATNMTLNVTPFTPGNGTASFSAVVIDPTQSASGTVRVTDGAGNFCDAVVLSGLNTDCSGVVGGSKTVDRCGVCGGDGSSCLGCSESNNFATLMQMDGKANKQLQLALRAIKQLSKASKKTSIRKLASSLMTSANQLYLKNWQIAWTLPATSASCTNNSFCASVSTAGSVNSYKANANNLLKIAQKAISNKQKVSGRKPKSDSTRLRQIKSAHKEALAAALKAPASVSSCL